MASSETREKNIERILRDGVRLREGIARFVKAYGASGLDLPVTVIAVDLDGSAAVRKSGIEAKVELVLASRRRMIEVVPPETAVVDSGTRDETYLVLPGHGATQAADAAERVRAVTAAHPFTISGVDGPVSITASVGYAVSDGSLAPHALLAAAQEAQFLAKQERNAVRAWAATRPASQRFTLQATVGTLLASCGLDWTDVVTTGVNALEEKLGGLWHWSVEQAGTEAGPTHWSNIDTSGLPESEVVYFRRLHESLAFETRAARAFPHHDYRIVVGPRPAEDAALAVEYLPGAWASAITSSSSDPAPAAVKLSAARLDHFGAHGAAETEVELPWPPSLAARFAKLRTRHGLSDEQLLVEAALLAVDKAAVHR